MMLLRRLASVLRRPLYGISTNKTESNVKSQNFYFKSKIIVLIGLIFLGTNILLSNLLIFNLDNYNHFINSSKKLDLYLDLQRTFFRQKEFLHQFKSFDTNKFNYEYFKSFVSFNDTIDDVNFNSNISSSAYLSHLTSVYERESDPESYLKQHKLPFHWADWVDISLAQPFINSYDELLSSSHFAGDELKLYNYVHKICYDKIYDIKDSWIDDETYDQRLSVWEHLQSIGVCSAIFKYYYWSIPERVLFETDLKYFEVPVQQRPGGETTYKSQKPLGLNGLSKLYYDSKNHISTKDVSKFINEHNREDQIDELTSIFESKGFQPEVLKLKETIEQNPKDFIKPDFDKLLTEYKDKVNPTTEDVKYLNFLEYSKNNVGQANKFYFIFPWIKADKKAELHHYTFPWLKQIISHEERIKVVHHLIRSWFKFAEHAQIISWFNYGNLIGWYFNSMNLPWDNDVDVQVSIKDLDKIGKYHNNSLVVENPHLGDGLFWLQTNPFYMQQNDFQFIDARYIDVKTGIYIDISALWSDDARRPDALQLEKDEIAFHCKHYNWFKYSEIFPIRRTIYEGAQAYMVNNVTSNLIKLYGDHPLHQTNEQEHNWQKDIGLWVPNEVCENEKVPATKDRFDENGDLTLYGACNNTELQEIYKHTKKAWDLHKRELELIKANESTTEITSESLPIFRFFNHEEFR